MPVIEPKVNDSAGLPVQAQAVISVNEAGDYAGPGSAYNAALSVTATPTVSVSPAYSIGDAIGGLMTFTGMARAAVGSGLLQNASLACKSAQTAAIDLVLFSANPTGSTITDNAPYSLAVADLPKVLTVVHLTDWTSQGTPSFAQGGQLATIYALTLGQTSVYGVLVARAALTLASTSDISVTLNGLPD